MGSLALMAWVDGIDVQSIVSRCCSMAMTVSMYHHDIMSLTQSIPAHWNPQAPHILGWRNMDTTAMKRCPLMYAQFTKFDVGRRLIDPRYLCYYVVWSGVFSSSIFTLILSKPGATRHSNYSSHPDIIVCIIVHASSSINPDLINLELELVESVTSGETPRSLEVFAQVVDLLDSGDERVIDGLWISLTFVICDRIRC